MYVNTERFAVAVALALKYIQEVFLLLIQLVLMFLDLYSKLDFVSLKNHLFVV